MEIVLMLLCIAGVSFAVKQLDGPFNLFATVRNLLTRVPVLGPMLFQVLTCNFCLGCWASAGLYLTTNAVGTWSLGDLVVWTFGGGMFNSLFCQLMDKLAITESLVSTSAAK